MNVLRSIVAAFILSISSVCLADSVNINTADADTIATRVKGIGPAKAAAIVDYRDKHGPFKSVDDLVLVKGVGEKTVMSNKDKLAVE